MQPAIKCLFCKKHTHNIYNTVHFYSFRDAVFKFCVRWRKGEEIKGKHVEEVKEKAVSLRANSANADFSPEFSAKEENPLTTRSKPPNKQIWIKTSSFRRFRRAFTFFWFGITCFARFRSRIPGRDVPASAAATSMRIQEVPKRSEKEKKKTQRPPLIPGELTSLPETGKEVREEAGRKLRLAPLMGCWEKEKERKERNGPKGFELLLRKAGLSSYVMLECGFGSGNAEEGCTGSPWMRPSAERRRRRKRRGAQWRHWHSVQNQLLSWFCEKHTKNKN